MSITTVFIAAFLPVACIAAVVALMRFFDVKEAGANQAQSDAEKLLVQVNREVKARRRVRAGAPSIVNLGDFSHFSSLSATRKDFPRPEHGTAVLRMRGYPDVGPASYKVKP